MSAMSRRKQLESVPRGYPALTLGQPWTFFVRDGIPSSCMNGLRSTLTHALHDDP